MLLHVLLSKLKTIALASLSIRQNYSSYSNLMQKIPIRSYPILIIVLALLFACNVTKQSKKIYFRAEKSIIQQGETIDLKWQCKRYKNIQIEGIQEGLQETGSIAVTPDTTTVYKIIAFRKANATKVKKITVVVNEPVFSLIHCSDSATDEKPVTLRWKALNTKKVTIEGLPDEFPAEGSTTINLDGPAKLMFTAINAYGKKAEKSIQIDVLIVESSFALPKRILETDTAKLYWNFKNTSSVTIEGLEKTFGPTDSLAVSPDSNTLYRITAHRMDGSTKTNTVSVNIYPAGIATFKGTTTIIKGDQSTLRWVTNGAKKVTLEGGDVFKEVPVSGTLSVKPSENTLYTLTAFCEEKTVSKQVMVNVILRNFVDSLISINSLKTGQRMDFQVFEVDRSKYPDEIKLKVLVVDTAGNFISGLAPKTAEKYATNKYFKKIVEIVENKSAPVKNFSVKEISDTLDQANDISLVFDYSGSMSGSIDPLIKSAQKFISTKTLRDRFSLVVFDSRIATLSALDPDKFRLLKAFATAVYSQFGQSTSLYAAVDNGLTTLEGSANDKKLFLFTDGYENSSFLHSDSLLYTSQDVVAKARRDSVRITTLAFGNDLNIPLLVYLSELTDGNSYNIHRNKDIMKAYKELAVISKHYYEITYKPAVADGEREVRLSCFNQIENVVVKRKMFMGENFLVSDWSMDHIQYYYIDSILITINKASTTGPVNPQKMSPLSVPQAIAFFEFSKDDLRAQDTTTLNYYVAWMRKNSSIRILLLGHTDLKGTDKSCEILSQQRADAVKTYLVNNGIDKNRIFAVAYGKRHPVNAQETDEEKAQENRRVEAVLLK